MKMLWKTSRLVVVSTALSFVVFAPSYGAGATPATGTLAVSATVSHYCLFISSNPLAFGPYDPTTSGGNTAMGSFQIKCSKGTTVPSIAMGFGGNATGGQRAMKSPTTSATLNYNITQPSSVAFGSAPNAGTCPTTPNGAWTDGTNSGTTLAPSPNNFPAMATDAVNVCGQLPAGQNVDAATDYQDSVTVTVNYS